MANEKKHPSRDANEGPRLASTPSRAPSVFIFAAPRPDSSDHFSVTSFGASLLSSSSIPSRANLASSRPPSGEEDGGAE